MKKLEQLIKELCPNGVKYKKLKDVCNKIVDGMHSLPKDITSYYEYWNCQEMCSQKIPKILDREESGGTMSRLS